MTEQQFQVGDEVIATSKTDPRTVIHGKVGSIIFGRYSYVKPQGHASHVCLTYEDFDIVKVEPPIVFGPDAVIRWKSGIGVRVRDSEGDAWRNSHGSVVVSTDGTYADAYKRDVIEVLYWGDGVEQ